MRGNAGPIGLRSLNHGCSFLDTEVAVESSNNLYYRIFNYSVC